MSVTTTPAWKKLANHHKNFVDADFTKARLDDFSTGIKGLRLDYAFQNVTSETITLLIDLAKQQNVEIWRDRMFSGEKINTTEKRAVLHTALRRTEDTPILVDGNDIMPEIRATQNRIMEFVDDVRGGKWCGATGKKFSHIVNIGIGGSDLGPRLAAQALCSFAKDIETHFVANIDAFDLQNTLKRLNPAETLFVVVSKTFTTQETLMNARSARQWLIEKLGLVEKLGEKAVAKHFVAVSTNRAEVENFGIQTENMFPTWDWVGGRYSVWSAVGLSVALAIGNENFREFLNGAAAMDAHFQSAPLNKNMPVLLALLGVWNRNFIGTSALAVMPYSERLRDFPRFLQQLDMESNGKSVTREGAPTQCATAPIIFGECGTVGQHSFHQCLHQGTDIIPCDFIGVAHDDEGQPDHHRVLLSNMVAQMGALAFGQKKAASPHDVYPGHRPSNLVLLDRLDPYHLGMFLSLYEHKVFVQGIIWGINSFDQPGVELGKKLAKGLNNNDNSGSVVDILGAFLNGISAE